MATTGFKGKITKRADIPPLALEHANKIISEHGKHYYQRMCQMSFTDTGEYGDAFMEDIDGDGYLALKLIVGLDAEDNIREPGGWVGGEIYNKYPALPVKRIDGYIVLYT
eukprot:TRINITY_DN5517_c0_g1_i2.p2 TRINITY_DN5517_c0_g1~~TRINITY_DN5517_c0_g1_i2.p2  ORF type:complete len:110 (-),score=17.85 TRINITY_DN5517_c0_g1_i2:215-544(-)